jgi:hypothetical protein
MTEKKLVSLNLSVDNVEWLDRVCNNRSAEVDEILTAYRRGGGNVEAAIERMRRELLLEKKRSLEGQLDSVESELNDIDDNIKTQEQHRNQVVQEAFDTLGDVPTNPDDAHIKHWAGKANMDPEEFAEAYEEMKE